MTGQLTPGQASGWEQYERQEPWGDECWYLAILCAWFFNANKTDGDPIAPTDVRAYVEWLKEGQPQTANKQTPQQAADILRNWALSQIR